MENTFWFCFLENSNKDQCNTFQQLANTVNIIQGEKNNFIVLVFPLLTRLEIIVSKIKLKIFSMQALWGWPWAWPHSRGKGYEQLLRRMDISLLSSILASSFHLSMIKKVDYMPNHFSSVNWKRLLLRRRQRSPSQEKKLRKMTIVSGGIEPLAFSLGNLCLNHWLIYTENLNFFFFFSTRGATF